MLEANVGCPGSCGDSPVWKRHLLFKALSLTQDAGISIPGFWIPFNGYGVCDGAYANRTYQLSPFEEGASAHLSVAQENYNRIVRRARRVVERVFGIIKKQFKLLTFPCEQSISRKTVMVWSILTVYNIMHRFKQAFVDEDSGAVDMGEDNNDESTRDSVQDMDDVDVDQGTALMRGYERRDALVLELYAHMTGPHSMH